MACNVYRIPNERYRACQQNYLIDLRIVPITKNVRQDELES